MLSGLRIVNFKAFRELEVELAPLTLLAGWNSAGKSSLIQSIAALKQSCDIGVLSRGLLLNGPLVGLGTGRDVLHEDYQGDSSSPSIQISIESRGAWKSFNFGYVADSDMLPSRPVDGRVYSPADLECLNEMHFLRADRHGPASYYDRSFHAVEVERSVGTRGEHAANFLRLRQDEAILESRRAPSSSGAALLDQVSAWLNFTSPGVNIDAQANEAADIVTLTYGYGGRAGINSSNRYRATNVGFGLSYVLPILVQCLTAVEGSVLLIENPEAHLHPRGQSAIAELIARTAASGVQVIVESHSDHILNGIRRAVKSNLISSRDTQLLYFARSQNGTVDIATPKLGPDGSLSVWPQGFFDEWDNALADLLQ